MSKKRSKSPIFICGEAWAIAHGADPVIIADKSGTLWAVEPRLASMRKVRAQGSIPKSTFKKALKARQREAQG